MEATKREGRIAVGVISLLPGEDNFSSMETCETAGMHKVPQDLGSDESGKC